MKFIIKASAVAVSDTKFAKRGEYETDDEKEIERLKNIAKKFPKDVEEASKGKQKEEPQEETDSEEATVVDEPQEEHPRRRR